MDAKISDYSTPSKTIKQLEKIAHHSTYNTSSPFRFLHHSYKTPESKLNRVNNPFETHLHDKLHTHFFSPSVFTKSSSLTTEENFKWTIEDISRIQPADIDEHPQEQFSTPDNDSMVESLVQSRIDKFFSMKEIVPSPYSHPVVMSPLIKACSSSPYRPPVTDNTCQTVLTLPPVLPPALEEALKPYFTYTHDQQDGEGFANCSLPRKLFNIHEVDENDSEQSSPARSIDLNLSEPRIRVFGGEPSAIEFISDGVETHDFLENCTLSPVVSGEEQNKSRIRVESTHMSVDQSFGVPEIEDFVPQDKSLNLDSTKSSMREALSDSTVNWDMEFKQIVSPDGNDREEMDVSNSNTPKSKIFVSQRKNLSNSFREELLADESDKVRSDTGYQTGYEDSAWNTSNFIASTPTKQKLFS